MGNGLIATKFDGLVGGLGTRFTRSPDLIGNADGSKGTVSFWFKVDGGTADQLIFNTGNARFRVRRLNVLGGSQMILTCFDNAGVKLVDIQNTTGFATSPTWRHILFAWDISGSPVANVFADGVDETVTNTLISGVIDYTPPFAEWGYGASFTGSGQFDGCLSEAYLNLTEFEPDVTKFRNPSTGAPVELGSDGSTPTGTAPIFYFSEGGVSTPVGTNAGTGGDFILSNSVAACATVPGVIAPSTSEDIIKAVRDEIIAFPKPNQKLLQKLLAAIDSLNNALAFLAGGNQRFSAKQVRQAIKNILFLVRLAKLSEVQGDDWNSRLTSAMRLEAELAINEAVARTGDADQIALAQDFLDEGDLEAVMGLGFFDDATKEYEKAILHGELA